MNEAEIDQIIEFWFSDRVKPLHFKSTAAFDQEVKDGYLGLWQCAQTGELDGWMESKEGCLALVILLDQFPLNMFRGQPEAFATERQSCEVAGFAIDAGFDQQMPAPWLAFLYLPFMHSESLSDQERSVSLFESELRVVETSVVL